MKHSLVLKNLRFYIISPDMIKDNVKILESLKPEELKLIRYEVDKISTYVKLNEVLKILMHRILLKINVLLNKST